MLPYLCPLATQTSVTVYNDKYGNVMIDPYDMSENIKNQAAHLCIFPYDGKTAVLFFYHKRDKAYKKLLHQFNSSPREDNLRYINYLLFALTENFYLPLELENFWYLEYVSEPRIYSEKQLMVFIVQTQNLIQQQ